MTDGHPRPEGRVIYLVGHAHIDLGYRWRWSETVHRVARDTFRGVLRMMDEYPELTFVQSQLALYEAMAQHYPDIFRRIKERVAEGRWIVADGWCEYDHTMPSGESMVRQHLLGSRYAREELGARVTMAWAPDAFSGHVQTLPTILKGCGIDALLFGRGMPEGTPYFWWEGPDGSRVLSYTPAFGYSADIGPGIIAQLERWEELTGLSAHLTLYGRGDHGGGPREDDLAALRDLRADPASPRLEHTTPRRFFSEVLAPLPNLPTYRGELGGGSTGSLSSEGRNKQRARAAENLLLTAERFATLSVFFQRKPVYDRIDFREAWKTVLRHQFHDEIPGTSRAAVFSDNAADYDAVSRAMTATLDNALAEMGARVDTLGEGVPVIVYNALAWARSEPVVVRVRLTAPPQHPVLRGPDGQSWPTQLLSCRQEGPFWHAELLTVARDVPSLGFVLARLVEGPDVAIGSAAVAASEDTLDNGTLRVVVDGETGHLRSVLDLRTGCEALAGPGAVLLAIAEEPGVSSAWIIALTDAVDALDAPESVEVIERGPVRGTIRVRYRYRDSALSQDISLTAGSDRVDLRFQAEWYERDCCLKVAFPAAVEGGRAAFDQPFGHIERPADGAEVPAQQWIDLSEASHGLSLLNDCRYGFDVRGNTLRMTLLRGVDDLDPRADEGHHDLRYALYPHARGWREAGTVRRGWEWNLPLLARQELRRAGIVPPWTSRGVLDPMGPVWSFLSVEPDNVVLTALKVEDEEWGQGSPFIVRLIETVGRESAAELRLPIALASCQETNHIEEPIDTGAVRWAGDRVWVHLGPYEVKTVLLRLSAMTLGVSEKRRGVSEVGDFAAGDETRLRKTE